jgi:mono/diheme cytochrome c family protein
MPFILLKSILAVFLLIAAAVAAISMFTIMGKPGKTADPKSLRKTHKISGWLFLILLIPLVSLGMSYWTSIGNQASIRAVFHAVLALGLIISILLKTAIVKFYKQFLRFAPGLGMLVFCLTFVVFSISAGFYSLRTLRAKPALSEGIELSSSDIVGNANNGASLFRTHCLSCHHPDSEDKKVGPGLKYLFQKEKLPYSGRLATVENVKRQLIRPAMVMPAFIRLTDQEMADLIAYLKTL